MSGFVLYPAYPQQTFNTWQFKNFLLRRSIRLWPLLAITTIILVFGRFLKVYVLQTPIEGIHRLSTIVLALLLVQLFSGAAAQMNGPSWSLSAEWLTNLVSYPYFARRGNIQILLLISLGYLLLFYSFQTNMDQIANSGPVFGLPGLGRCIVGFGFGLLLRKNLARCSVFQNNFSLSIVLSTCFFLIFLSGNFIQVAVFLASPIFAFLVLQLVRYSVVASSPFGRLANYLGEVSYGIYLIHVPISGMGLNYFRNAGIVEGLFLSIALSVIGSTFLIFCLERPFREYLTKRIF